MTVRKIVIITLFSMACILGFLYLYQKHCEKELEIYMKNLEVEIIEEVSAEKKSEQNLMLDSLINEAGESAKNIWRNNINYHIKNATTEVDSNVIAFNTEPYLIGKIEENQYVLQAAIYRKGGFTACEIDKTSSYEITNRFGRPTKKEFEIKYIYKKGNTEISLLFDNSGILKNIVLNFN